MLVSTIEKLTFQKNCIKFNLNFNHHNWPEATILDHTWTLLCMELSCWLKKIDSRKRAGRDAEYDLKKKKVMIAPAPQSVGENKTKLNTSLSDIIKLAHYPFPSRE